MKNVCLSYYFQLKSLILKVTGWDENSIPEVSGKYGCDHTEHAYVHMVITKVGL